MIVVYLLLIALLAVVQLLLRWRAVSLEGRYIQVSAEAEALLKQASTRAGNSNKPDPCQAARVQYELALVTLRRDRVEQAYTWWQSAAERVAHWLRGMLGYNGKVVPYLMGILDIAAVVTLVSWLVGTLPQLQTLVGLSG